MTGVSKTTFAAPASPTSGLQGYDLEGADGPKSRTFYRFGGKITLGPEKCEDPDVKKAATVLAAGFVLVTDEGKALFLKRAEGGDHAGEWCFPGGKIEAGETALQAAIRETFEEIKFKIDPEDEHAEVCQVTLNGVDFTTFFQRVEEFEPTLDHEHTAFRWAPIDQPPEPLHPGARSTLALVISQATVLTMKVAKGEKRTLYIKRRLRTGEALKEWSDSNGFPTTLTTDDMHVTIAYSKTPVEWASVPRSSQPILRIEGGARTLDRLGKDGEAVVLRFESDDLASRHREIHDAGAVWSWPDYKAHITLTYQGEALPLDGMVPFDGVLEFGPEEWAEVKENWMSTVVEKHDAGEPEMNNLSLFVQLNKVDAKNRIVYGTAVEEVKDRAGEIFDYATSKPEFEKWSGDIEKSTDGKSKGNVRAMHGKVAAGKLTEIGFDDVRKAIDVAAKIVDEDEWKKVEEGVYTGFSIGGSYVKKWTDTDSLKRYTARPAEISLVDLPCVPTATFSMVKADGTEELRKFHQPIADAPVTVTVTNEAVATRAEEMAKAAGNHFLDHVIEARKQLEGELAKAAEVKAAEVKAAEVKAEATAVAKTEITPEAPVVDSQVNKDVTTITNASGSSITMKTDGSIVIEAAALKVAPVEATGEWEQVWVSKRLPGQTFAKKGDLTKALTELDAKDAAALAAAPVLDALKAAGVEKPVEKTVEKTVEGAVEKSEGETITVVTIDSKEALAEALKVLDPAKSVALAAKRNLIKAARKLDAVATLPEGWVVAKAEETDELKKSASLYFVADLLRMLSCVEGLEEQAEYTSLYGGVAVPKVLTDRFGSVLVELGDIVADMLDLVLAEIREEERGEAIKSVAITDLFKRGARHSTGDKKLIKEAHDAIASLDKSCCGGMDKAVGEGDLAKGADIEAITAENELLKAQKAANGDLLLDIKAGIDLMKGKMDTITAENVELKKTVEEIKEGNANSIEEVQKSVLAIRYLPAPSPAGSFRVAEKTVPVGDFNAITEDELRARANVAQANRMNR